VEEKPGRFPFASIAAHFVAGSNADREERKERGGVREALEKSPSLLRRVPHGAEAAVPFASFAVSRFFQEQCRKEGSIDVSRRS
jgi:hypothetical protein